MSSHEHKSVDFRIGSDALWSKAWKIPLIVAGIGLLMMLISADAIRLGYAYLFGLMAVWTLVFGGMFLVLIQFLTVAHWGVTSRRIAETIMSGAPVAALLTLPFIIGVGTGKLHLYDEWMRRTEHGSAHHAPEHSSTQNFEAATAKASDDTHAAKAEEEHQHTPQEVALHHEVLAKKSGYLNKASWLGRAAAYLVIWSILGLAYFLCSRRQDETKDIKLTSRMQSWAAFSLFVFGTTLTFAAFDWMMALEPSWYSTIFGVVIFAGSAVVILAFTILVGLSFYKRGLTADFINPIHFHDLAKLMFGFICFWTYVQFSQWMLIWYASIPEETTWFHKRWEGGWMCISLLLIFGHFVAPFLLLMSRVQKLSFGWLRLMCFWMIAMHIIDIYWFILPQAGALRFHPADFGALMLLGGLFLSYVFWKLTTIPLIPIGDPRLQRSLHHFQTH